MCSKVCSHVFVAVQSLSHVWLLATLWTAARQASLSLLSPRICSNYVHWVGKTIQPSHPLSTPFLLPSAFPSISVFFSESTFHVRWQSIGASASASVLPMNIQGWFPLGLTGLISLLSKGLSIVFFSTTLRKHQFFGTQPSLWSNSHTHTWLLEKP